jgi:YfiH family protein
LLLTTFFTNRLGGVSRAPYDNNNLALHVGDDSAFVDQNRRNISTDTGKIQFMQQSHGDTVAVVDGVSNSEPHADALVTGVSGITLAVLVADCIPLLLWDNVEKIMAVVHVGRRGLLNEIALKTVTVMNSLGAVRIQGLLGPSICGQCYEVGDEICEAVSTAFPLARSENGSGNPTLDLPRALMHMLSNVGVKVSRSSICTVENLNYYSYRRDGVTGRQAGLISQ